MNDLFIFILYYFISTFLYQLSMVLYVLIRRKFDAYSLQKLINTGKIQLMTQEEFTKRMEAEEKKTWN